MKGKITIQFENGSKQEFDAEHIEYNWIRDPAPHLYSAGSQEPIGIEAHNAYLSIKARQHIPTEIFPEKEKNTMDSLYKFTITDDRNYPFSEIWASAQRNAQERDLYEQECGGFNGWPEYTVVLVNAETEEGSGEYDRKVYYFNVLKGNHYE